MTVWKLKRIVVITMLLASMLFVFNTSVMAQGGNVTISNVSPVNESIANEIVGNPPEWAGYINLSCTLTDGDGGDDMEFYINVSVNGTWINRLHQIGASSGNFYHHEDTMNHTNSTYYWNVSYRDGSESFKTDLFHFRSEAKPDPPDTPSPVNGSMHLYGNVTLSCVVHHPDGGSAPAMNVTFYEWPSERIIGYDNSSLSDGNTATCDTSYYCPVNGTKYYWYAKTRDDEFTGNNSDAWFVDIYYNDTEPTTVWYTLSGDIWVESPYAETEPTMVWYTTGGIIHLYFNATFHNPVPADDAIDQWTNLMLSLDINTTTPKYMNFKMRPDGAGTTTELNESGAATNWECVDEVTADDDSTLVYTDDIVSDDLDLYNLPDHTVAQHGDQLNVTIYFRCKNNTRPECNNTGPGTANGTIRTHNTDYQGDTETLTNSWTTYEHTWDLNPNTNQEWTWDEIDDLEAGIEMIGGNCTQVYINVHYRQSVTLLTTQFYTNNTVDESWVQIGSDIPEQRTNYTATMPFSSLQFDTDYWWRVRVYNTTVEQDQNSSDYHFTTMSPPSEPDAIWYTMGGDIWTEPTYTETEPTAVWYTLGGNISIYFFLGFTNESPVSGTTGLWRSLVLSAWAHKSGDPVQYDFTFYTNDTVDESWVQIGTLLSQQLTNLTVSIGFSGLEWNKTYYWKVIGVNDTLETNDSSAIWHFKTNYSVEEPSILWYTLGGTIWTEPIYIETEPDIIWYTMGGNILIGAPYKPINPVPADGTEAGKHIYPDFSCYVEDPQSYRMNVSFYWINGTLIGTDTYVASGTRASVPVGWLTNYTWHEWYVIANNSPDASSVETRSDTWRYKPGNQMPTGNFTPWEAATHVAVRRQLVGGTYQYFVRLTWNITDIEGDDIEFNCFVDDPAIGNWDDWISRHHIYDASNGTYHHDETLFDTPVVSYHWRMYLADIYNGSNNYMNFTTGFFFWSSFNWTPYRASTEDNVLLIDQSVNATDYWWYVNGVLIANASGLNATDQFNTTYQFNISNVYNVTLVVYNVSADVTDSMTRFIYIDRNLSLDRSDISAVTYYGQSPNGSTNASNLCSLLGISSNAWVHMYNNTRYQWDSFWIDFPSLTTDFNISLWDALAIVIGEDLSKRINITENPDQRESFFSRVVALENMSNASQILTLSQGYNYICWSNITATTSYNLSIGLVAAQDRIYKYNTQTGDWATYWFGMSGSCFDIESYDILVLSLGASKTITIGDGFNG